MRELPTPPDLDGDPAAVEILRIWIVQQELRCSLHTEAFDDTITWGVLLADVVRSIADALKANEGKDVAETLREIATAFREELAHEAGS
jgi:Domain of unknown function (DUF5076)